MSSMGASSWTERTGTVRRRASPSTARGAFLLPVSEVHDGFPQAAFAIGRRF
jgi:hypothetical protein